MRGILSNYFIINIVSDGLKESGEETVSPENSEKYREIEKDLKLKSKKFAKLAKEIDQVNISRVTICLIKYSKIMISLSKNYYLFELNLLLLS